MTMTEKASPENQKDVGARDSSTNPPSTMAAVRVHTMSPINSNSPVKAAGVTPMTDAHYNQGSPVRNSAKTTSPISNAYRPAQPGAPAVPQPTGLAIGPASALKRPTPTTEPPPSSTANGPAPPQPGAVPSPYLSQNPPPSYPASPQAGYNASNPNLNSYIPPTSTQSSFSLSPYQQTPNLISSPRAQPPAGVTASGTDLSHPPGYQQNDRGSFGDTYQPTVTDHNNDSIYNGSRQQQAGLLGVNMGNPLEDGEDGTVWNTAMAWAKAAGKKLSETEEQIWNKINNDK